LKTHDAPLHGAKGTDGDPLTRTSVRVADRIAKPELRPMPGKSNKIAFVP
jgi:hypothetical protein